MKKTAFVFACSLSLMGLAGCVAKTPGLIGGPVSYATGNLSLCIKWPNRLQTQALPESTQALVVTVTEGENTLQQTTFPRGTDATGSVNLTLKAGTFTLEARAYRTATPDVGVDQAIAGGQTTVTIHPSQTTAAQLLMSLDFDALSYHVTTYVPNGSGDGNGTNCVIPSRAWLTRDPNGNIFIAEQDSQRIRKIDPAGNVSVFAGNGHMGCVEGQGTAAEFNVPIGITSDADGNIFVSDLFNWRIRKITPSGYVSTFAGSDGGYVDGSAAKFDNPRGLAAKGGIVYVADAANGRIRKIDSSGNVTTFVGGAANNYADGTGSAAGFSFPLSIVVDDASNLFVADNRSIRKVTPEGAVTTIAGSSQSGYVDGIGANARFSSLMSIELGENGSLYVADQNCIRKLTYNASENNYSVSTYAGMQQAAGFIEGNGTEARFNGICGLVRSPDGKLYVGDSENYRIRVIAPNQDVTTFAGNGETSYLDGPVNIAMISSPNGFTADPQGNLYVVDNGNNRIRKVSPTGIVSTLAGSSVAGFQDGIGSSANFNSPDHIVLDSKGCLFVTDYNNNRIRKITQDGTVTTFAGGSQGNQDGAGIEARFAHPAGIAIDSNDNLYVADSGNTRIRKITPNGMVSTPPQGDPLIVMGAIGVDGAGNLYVADLGTMGVYKIDSTGNKTSLAGNAVSGYQDGQGSSAQFSLMYGLAVDRQGNVFVSESDNRCIRRISPSGDVTTIAGNRSNTVDGVTDGIGTQALFVDPWAICIGNNGALYVSDGGSLIRKLTPR